MVRVHAALGLDRATVGEFNTQHLNCHQYCAPHIPVISMVELIIIMIVWQVEKRVGCILQQRLSALRLSDTSRFCLL